MGDTPMPEPAPPTKEEKVERVARIVIAGDENGAVRRIALYTIVGSAFLAEAGVAGGGLLPAILALPGVVALMLLALTDRFA